MINPNKVSRTRGTVIEVIKRYNGMEAYKVICGNTIVEHYEDYRPGTFKLNQIVNVQIKYSIFLDRYVAKTVRKIKLSKRDLEFKANMDKLVLVKG